MQQLGGRCFGTIWCRGAFIDFVCFRWEKDGQYPRAAAWLVFTRQFSKALETLLKSNGVSFARC